MAGNSSRRGAVKKSAKGNPTAQDVIAQYRAGQ